MTKLIVLLTTLFLTWNCSKESIEPSTSNHVSYRTTYTISGKVVWEKDSVTGVGNVVVSLSDGQKDTTGTDGVYSFNVENAGTYTITPSKPTNVLNGVTGTDATIIQQVLIGIVKFNNRYKVIAADVSGDRVLTTVDASIIRQAILLQPVAYGKMSPAWKFVDKSYIFTGSFYTVPVNYPQSISVNITGDSFNNDFIGIKRGDVDNTADPSL